MTTQPQREDNTPATEPPADCGCYIEAGWTIKHCPRHSEENVTALETLLGQAQRWWRGPSIRRWMWRRRLRAVLARANGGAS